MNIDIKSKRFDCMNFDNLAAGEKFYIEADSGLHKIYCRLHHVEISSPDTNDVYNAFSLSDSRLCYIAPSKIVYPLSETALNLTVNLDL